MKHIKPLYRKSSLLCLLYIAACTLFFSCSDDETTVVPENWISISNEAFSAGYESETLSRDFTVPAEVNPSYVYTISTADWCRAYIEGNTVFLNISASTITQEREGSIIVIYDQEHQVEIPVVQAAAPAAKVSEIVLPLSLNNQAIGLGQVFDLTPLIEVLPANAGNKRLSYTVEEGQNVVSITNGVLKVLNEGTAIIKVSATDGSGVSAELKIIGSGQLPFIRNDWSVTTSITYANGGNYVADGTTGKPEDIIDGDASTFLSLVKPGKTYNGYNTPTDHQLSFTVDMGVEQTFNYFVWAHRMGNSYDYLRVWGVSIYGSNDGETFSKIQSDIDIPHSSNTEEINIDLPETTCRYIKVELVKWSDIAGGAKSGSSMQIGEFNVGKK